jgi:ADP-heptose:LPS heptosyltransferase/SAM-dependent methyltransferase
MEHHLFQPKGLEEGKHAVVGDCNGFSMSQRWEQETPLFAQAIAKYFKTDNEVVLDYGCGVGRLAKEILKNQKVVNLIGLDASSKMLDLAKDYVGDSRFGITLPNQLDVDLKFDVIYCIYVLQHAPAIEIRDILSRIHYHLKDNGTFIYCSSDYRMAIRFDNQGFFDDRFLGVNLQEEISRFFQLDSELFDESILDNNDILKRMIKGSLPHPALVYHKKPVKLYFNSTNENKIESVKTKIDIQEAKKLLLTNRLAPGDILVMTNAIRDLHLAYPQKYQTDIRTPCNEIFENNPYITKLQYDDSAFNKINARFSGLGDKGDPFEHLDWIDDILVIDMHYPLIHKSGVLGSHFSEGHRDFLELILNVKIPQTDLRPQIFLSQTERDWVSPLVTKRGVKDKYWVLNAGTKGDYTLKQYPFYQEVVDLLKDKIKLVQIGETNHNHKSLNDVIDFRGKTNIRELFRLIYHAQGVITCVSFPMHIAAALNKPCVVVAGAREGTRWELYPSHQFLYVNGCLPCATYDGCWKSKLSDCKNKENDIPRCMTLILPEDVAKAVIRYYNGRMLTY